MRIMTVEVENENGVHLLEELEKLSVLKILKDKPSGAKSIADKYRGVFSKEDADSFMNHTNSMRKEWDNT